MKKRKIEMLEDVMGAIGDRRWDLVVNDFHDDEDFDYAIVHAGTGISMNRINLGDRDYFGMYLEDYETPDVQDGLETYGEVYEKVDGGHKKAMLESLHQSIIDELEAQGQYAPHDDEGVNVYSTAFFEDEEGDEDE